MLTREGCGVTGKRTRVALHFRKSFHNLEFLFSEVAARDIVQFVEMRRFEYGQGQYDQTGLAKAVLAEVPKQVVGWMKMRGLTPLHS